jgi:azurin
MYPDGIYALKPEIAPSPKDRINVLNLMHCSHLFVAFILTFAQNPIFSMWFMVKEWNRILDKNLSVLISMFLLFSIVSCGDKAASGTTSASGERLITIKVTGTSIADMRFSPNNISIKKGEKVKLTLNNTIRAEGLYQNWVLVNLGSAQEVVNNAMAEGMQNNYVPSGKNVVTATPLAAPGATVDVSFTAPASGTYQFISTFPGNYPKMTGKLVVE